MKGRIGFALCRRSVTATGSVSGRYPSVSQSSGYQSSGPQSGSLNGHQEKWTTELIKDENDLQISSLWLWRGFGLFGRTPTPGARALVFSAFSAEWPVGGI